MKKLKLLFSLLLIVSFFFGCSATRIIEDEESLSAERIVKRIEANRRKVKSFVGVGTISVFTKELNTKSNFRIEIKKPDSLKVSFYGPFGIDLAAALVTPNDFLFFDMINNKVIKGKANKETISEILKVNFPHDELIDAITGSANLSNKISLTPEISKIEESKYQLVYPDSSNNIITKISIDIASLNLLKLLITDLNGKTNYLAEYDNFRKVEEVYIPYNINIEDKINNQKLKIEYRKVEVNKFSEKLKIEVPDDAIVKEL